MVAYSFAPQFVDAVASGAKLQTVRAPRRRHAQAGEPVQLYAGMRTKHCRKLVPVDPTVLDVRHITIRLSDADPSLVIDAIEIEGVPLSDAEIEVFATADGFGTAPSARRRMGLFWQKAHPGVEHFEGVVIRWGDA
ncbi:hypothetical protein [Sphingomonas koreensis]